VQDDIDELTREISNQAQIYQNGVVTILAGGARSAEEGFLRKRQMLRYRYRIKIRLPGSDCAEAVLLFDYFKIGYTEVQDPVSCRAWIFQEGKVLLIVLGSTILT
jgi:hypothetical protein